MKRIFSAALLTILVSACLWASDASISFEHGELFHAAFDISERKCTAFTYDDGFLSIGKGAAADRTMLLSGIPYHISYRIRNSGISYDADLENGMRTLSYDGFQLVLHDGRPKVNDDYQRRYDLSDCGNFILLGTYGHPMDFQIAYSDLGLFTAFRGEINISRFYYRSMNYDDIFSAEIGIRDDDCSLYIRNEIDRFLIYGGHYQERRSRIGGRFAEGNFSLTCHADADFLSDGTKKTHAMLEFSFENSFSSFRFRAKVDEKNGISFIYALDLGDVHIMWNGGRSISLSGTLKLGDIVCDYSLSREGMKVNATIFL